VLTVIAAELSDGTRDRVTLGKVLMCKVISVCLDACPIITHENLDRFASNFDWRTQQLGLIILS